MQGCIIMIIEHINLIYWFMLMLLQVLFVKT